MTNALTGDEIFKKRKKMITKKVEKRKISKKKEKKKKKRFALAASLIPSIPYHIMHSITSSLYLL